MTADLLTLTVNLGFLLAGSLLGFAAGMRFTSLSLKRERGKKPAETPADFGGFGAWYPDPHAPVLYHEQPINDTSGELQTPRHNQFTEDEVAEDGNES